MRTCNECRSGNMESYKSKTIKNGIRKTHRRCNHCGHTGATVQVEIDEKGLVGRSPLGKAVKVWLVVEDEHGVRDEIPGIIPHVTG